MAAEFRQPLCDSEGSFRIPDELFQRRKAKIVRRKARIQQKPKIRWRNVMSYERGILTNDVRDQPILFRIAELAEEPPGAQGDIPNKRTIRLRRSSFSAARCGLFSHLQIQLDDPHNSRNGNAGKQ